jgi:hypothetical protein
MSDRKRGLLWYRYAIYHTISVTFGSLARKHNGLTLHYQWFDPFQILVSDSILILANHDQSVLDKAYLHCLKLGAGGEFPKKSSNKRKIITYVCPQTPRLALRHWPQLIDYLLDITGLYLPVVLNIHYYRRAMLHNKGSWVG